MISTKNVMSNILSIISKKCKGNIILMTTSINDLFFEAGLEEKLIKSSNPLDIKFSYDETCKLAELLNVTPAELMK